MTGVYKRLVAPSGVLPWRVRNGLQQWMEIKGRARFPTLYRLAHFGTAVDRVRPLTTGPRHHFFGYYDKTPWNASGRLVLAHQVNFNDRAPTANDVATIGVVDFRTGNHFEALGTTCAWNWQQGAMLQWHPADPERLLIYNDRRDGQPVSIVRDVAGREIRTYSLPIYAVAPDGRHALSLNFARLHVHRPGYGYAGISDPWADSLLPADDGIRLIDLETGSADLVVSLEALAGFDSVPGMRDVHHWVNHIQVSPDGDRFAFFHLWRVGEKGWHTRLFTARLDGSELECLIDAEVISHYDWRDSERLLVWSLLPGIGNRFFLCNRATREMTVVGDGVLTEDGHCSYSPDREWVLNDTYPDRYQMRTLMVFRPSDGRRVDLARLHSPKDRWWGEIRCDLHPRWSRDGANVCIDSVHSGERQMYTIDVAGFLR